MTGFVERSGAALDRHVVCRSAGYVATVRGNALRADRLQQFAVERKFSDRVVVVIGEIGDVVHYRYPVGVLEAALAPGRNEAAIGVVDPDRMLCACEEVDSPLGVGGD